MDLAYQRVPDAPFRIAHIAFDSDELPDEWVQIVNAGFDLLMCYHHRTSSTWRARPA